MATTPEQITPEDGARHVRRIAEERARLGRERAREMRAALGSIASSIKDVHGAEAVWLFGSVARDDAGPESDLDLAVRGLSAVQVAAVRGEMSADYPWETDVVRLESAPQSLVDRVVAEGEQL